MRHVASSWRAYVPPRRLSMRQITEVLELSYRNCPEHRHKWVDSAELPRTTPSLSPTTDAMRKALLQLRELKEVRAVAEVHPRAPSRRSANHGQSCSAAHFPRHRR